MVLRRVTLVRHGESAGNVAASAAQAAGSEVIDIAWRDADVPLSDLGQQQAAAVGTWLSGLPTDQLPAQVWASSYWRAQQTAQLAQQAAGTNIPTRVDERLRDRELGILDMLTWAGVQARLPEEAARRRWLGKFYHRPPGGESWADVALRIRSLLVDFEFRPMPDHVLIFTHDAVVWLFRYVLEGLTEQQLLDATVGSTVLNASISSFVRADADAPWQPDLFNSTEHLRSLSVEVTTHGTDSVERPR